MPLEENAPSTASASTLPIRHLNTPTFSFQNLLPIIPEFDGDANKISDFFGKLSLASELASWTDEEKLNIALLKLKDKALEYANLQQLQNGTFQHSNRI